MHVFIIDESTKFERLLETLVKKHVPIVKHYDEIILILEADPYNRSRQYKIKKLVDAEDGQWRLSVGAYRVRYDIEGRRVKLKSIRHRRDSYRGKKI